MFLLLRVVSALGGVVNGFALTYAFARVLEPAIFALFIWTANLGVSLWLFDLGLGRVLYSRLRAHYLSGSLRGNRVVAMQATGLVAAYTLLVVLGSVAAEPLGERFGHGVSLALFFAFSALNLPWNMLRQVAAGVECFVAFETLEATRRVLHLGLVLGLCFGLPLIPCLLAGNAVWAGLLLTATVVLSRAGGLAVASPASLFRAVRQFLSSNRGELAWSASYVGSEMYIYSYPPLLVPVVYGLGEAAIAFDTAYKVFRGTNLLLAAACEVATPWQTRAHAAGDRRSMAIATGTAALLSFAPAAVVCAGLVFADRSLFPLLLGHAAAVPHALALLMAVLVAGNWIQTVANSALLYNGYFRPMGRLALTSAVLLSAPVAYALLLRPGVVEFTAAYALVYSLCAVAYLLLGVRLPLRVGFPAVKTAA